MGAKRVVGFLAVMAGLLLVGCGGDGGSDETATSGADEPTTVADGDEVETDGAVVAACLEQAAATDTYLASLVGEEFTASALEQLNASLSAAGDACIEAESTFFEVDPERQSAVQDYLGEQLRIQVDIAASFEQGQDMAPILEADSAALSEATDALEAALG